MVLLNGISIFEILPTTTLQLAPKVVQFWCQRTQNLATKVLKKCQPGDWKIVIQGTENVPTKELKYRQLTNSLSRVLKKHQPGGLLAKGKAVYGLFA